MSNPNLTRGLVLSQQGRSDDAVAMFKQGIAEEPGNWYGYYLLGNEFGSMNGREADAVRTLDRGISINPDMALLHGRRATILSVMGKNRQALAAAKTARDLEPDDAYTAYVMAVVYVNQGKWKDAERYIRICLDQDPEDEDYLEILSMVLRMSGRQEEAAEVAGTILAAQPDSTGAHTAAGYAALHGGQIVKAEDHFLEALRIHPNNEHAKEGLLSAYRTRSASYRVFLKYSLFMTRLSGQLRMALILGLYFGVRFLRETFADTHPVVTGVLVFVYMAFVLWGWVAESLANFFVSWDRKARHALSRNELISGWATGVGICLGLPFLVADIAFDVKFGWVIGGGLLAQMIPTNLTFQNPRHKLWPLFAVISGCGWMAGILGLGGMFLPSVFEAASVYAALGAIFGAVACTWLTLFVRR